MFKSIVSKKPQEIHANHTGGASLLERLSHALPSKPASTRASYIKLGWCAAALIGSVAVSVPVFAQQKTGPGISEDDSLTWHGITLYGVIDVGLQYDTHSAPFTPYRPAASGNIVRQNSRDESVVGVTPSNMGQSRVGLQGIEPLVERLVGRVPGRRPSSTRSPARSPIP